MPGSLTTPGCPSTRVGVLEHVAFRYLYSVGTQDILGRSGRPTLMLMSASAWPGRVAGSRSQRGRGSSPTMAALRRAEATASPLTTVVVPTRARDRPARAGWTPPQTEGDVADSCPR
jgi:hypothetical protein